MTTLSKIAEVFISAGVVQGFFLALILLTGKEGTNRSTRILAGLLVLLSLSLAHSVFISGSIGGPYGVKEPFVLLVGPLLFLYVREIVHGGSISLRDIFHAVPFALFFVVVIPLVVHGDASAYGRVLFENPAAMGAGVWALMVAQYGFYWWKSLRLIQLHRGAVESEFSNTEGKTLSWMRVFLHVFGLFFVLLTFTLFLALHTANYTLVDLIVCVALSSAIFVLGYEGLRQEQVFSNVTGLQSASNRPNETGPAMSAGEPDEFEQELGKKVLTYLDDRKPFLDENLTLTELARQLGLPRNQLSHVVNNVLGDNFYVLINRYRVEEVKRLLADKTKEKFTILSLAYEAGFPSKSSFHTIFKKVTGITPTEYRHRIR